MKGIIYIDEDLIGEVDFKIIDKGMGVIGGDLIPDNLYYKYQDRIRVLNEKVGIAGMQDFNFKAIVKGLTLNPDGGIGIMDISEFNEIAVEVAGVDLQAIVENEQNSNLPECQENLMDQRLKAIEENPESIKPIDKLFKLLNREDE